MLSAEHSKQKEVNRSYLLKILQNLIYLAHQGLPMRGNWVSVEGGIGCEEDGSYLHCCWPDLPKSASPSPDDTRTESFISLASPLDLQRAFSEPGFVTKVDQLAVEVQTSDAVECAENFVCLLRETLLTLPKKSRRQRSQKISFPCNEWFDIECKCMKRVVNNIGKMLKQAPKNPDLITKYWKQKKA